ncbi:YodC family protein [Trinickia sp. NRRL B-1857]|uniref:YodC family protein n=1 Tax=Trinickia sp. NRRL B-1857 TaxID=3162879 RepID=UPI003D2E9C1A
MSTATRDLVDQFCVGDVVTLKVGGSRMTVTAVSNDAVLCQWFDEHGEFRQDTFAGEALGREPRSISPGLVHVRLYAAAMAGSVAAGMPFVEAALKSAL